MAGEGNQKASHLLGLLEKPSRFLATIQIGITLAGFLASAFAAESFSGPIVVALMGMNLPLSQRGLELFILVVITLILAFFTLVCGELVPKRIAMQKYEAIAFFSVKPLLLIMKLTKPFVKLLTLTTNGILKVLRVSLDQEEASGSPEEIRLLVEIGREKGQIEDHESTMIHNVFEFSHKHAKELMTHRVNMCAVSDDISLHALSEVIKKHQHSRLPVYHDTIDQIIGFLHIKDLLTPLLNQEDQNFHVSTYLRAVITVPLHMPADKLFGEMQAKKAHMAIVLDDYGGTAGLMTMEDLLEEIMGAIFDEYDQDDVHEFIKLGESHYEVSGLMSLKDLGQRLGVKFPEAPYDTLNSYLMAQFGQMPREGAIWTDDQYQFKVVSCTWRRIESVEVSLVKD